MSGGLNKLLRDNSNKFNVIGGKIDGESEMIKDKLCEVEMGEMENKIDRLGGEK